MLALELFRMSDGEYRLHILLPFDPVFVGLGAGVFCAFQIALENWDVECFGNSLADVIALVVSTPNLFEPV